MREAVAFARAGFLTCFLATAVMGLFSSCGPQLSSPEAPPPKLAEGSSLMKFQCYYVSVPAGFHLLEDQEGVHVAGIFSREDGERLLEQMKRRRRFEIVSAPSITTRQGQSGKVEMIREFIYPTEYEPPVLGKAPESGEAGTFPVTPATPTKFETRDVGLTAGLKGRASRKGAIDIDFDLERTAFLGFVNYGSPIMVPGRGAFGKTVEVTMTDNRIEMPVFDVKRLNSKATISSGQFLVIGGLKAEPQKPLEKASSGTSPTYPGWEGEPDEHLFFLIQAEAIGPQGS